MWLFKRKYWRVTVWNHWLERKTLWQKLRIHILSVLSCGVRYIFLAIYRHETINFDNRWTVLFCLQALLRSSDKSWRDRGATTLGIDFLIALITLSSCGWVNYWVKGVQLVASGVVEDMLQLFLQQNTKRRGPKTCRLISFISLKWPLAVTVSEQLSDSMCAPLLNLRKIDAIWNGDTVPDGDGGEKHHGGHIVQESGEDGSDETEDDDHWPNSSSG